MSDKSDDFSDDDFDDKEFSDLDDDGFSDSGLGGDSFQDSMAESKKAGGGGKGGAAGKAGAAGDASTQLVDNQHFDEAVSLNSEDGDSIDESVDTEGIKSPAVPRKGGGNDGGSGGGGGGGGGRSPGSAMKSTGRGDSPPGGKGGDSLGASQNDSMDEPEIPGGRGYGQEQERPRAARGKGRDGSGRGRGGGGASGGMHGGSDSEDESSDSEDSEDASPPQRRPGAGATLTGGAGGLGAGAGGEGPTKQAAPEGYNPADFANLNVSAEVRELFQYIGRYKPHNIELDTKLKCFIPDYIPAVGEIDAFLKVPRPDGAKDELGLGVLDEPAASQSDPTVLDLQLRAISKKSNLAEMVVRSIDNADKNPKEIQKWIRSINDLHRQKPNPQVHYTKAMPDIESLMEEWPPEVEQCLKQIVHLPGADLDLDLKDYARVVCSIMDIPVYHNVIESLHVMCTLYREFTNNQHFQNIVRGQQGGGIPQGPLGGVPKSAPGGMGAGTGSAEMKFGGDLEGKE